MGICCVSFCVCVSCTTNLSVFSILVTYPDIAGSLCNLMYFILCIQKHYFEKGHIGPRLPQGFVAHTKQKNLYTEETQRYPQGDRYKQLRAALSAIVKTSIWKDLRGMSSQLTKVQSLNGPPQSLTACRFIYFSHSAMKLHGSPPVQALPLRKQCLTPSLLQ